VVYLPLLEAARSESSAFCITTLTVGRLFFESLTGSLQIFSKAHLQKSFKEGLKYGLSHWTVFVFLTYNK